MCKPYNILDISCYIIDRHKELCSETPITNPRLQKLLYLIQVESIRKDGKEIFKEELIAWSYGPIVKVPYVIFSVYEENELPKINSGAYFPLLSYNANSLSEVDKVLIDTILLKYASTSTYALVGIICSQKPWRDAYCKGPSTVVGVEDIRHFIKESTNTKL